MKRNIIIAGGGTGGHIYPGLSIAQSIQKIDPEVQIHFVGTKYGLESRIIPQNNFPIHFISIGGINNLSFLDKLSSYIKFPLAFLQTLLLLIKLRPKLVFGVGGYSSGPVVLIAALLGIKTALFESNAIPGITNRILSWFVGTSFCLFEESKKYLKSKNIFLLGFPVRSQMERCPSRTNSNLRVLIFGGSQGARGINTTVFQALLKFRNEFDGIEFIHQTGRLDFAAISPGYKTISNVQCFEYLDPMKKYYDWADVVFCRAGASTISELSACGKAAVFIPFPFAADDHQKKNAMSLVDKKAALMVEQKDFTPEKFLELVLHFNKNRQEIADLEKKIQDFYKPEASTKIAQHLLK